MNTPALSEPKLTKKERAFLKEYFLTGNGTLSALKTYDTDNYASASEIASQNLRRLKNPMKAFMEANGFSFKVLLSVLADGLQAKKLEDLSGEKVPDHGVRHKYLTTASKWLGVDSDLVLMQQINMEKNNNFRETSMMDEEMPPEVKEWYHSHGLPVPLMGGLTNLQGMVEITYANTESESKGKNVVAFTNFEKPKDETTINAKEMTDEELESYAKTNNS